MRPPVLALSLCLLASPALAEVYRYIDAQGNIVFTDNPPEQTDAKKIELPPVNSLPAPAPASSTARDTQAPDAQESSPYSRFELLVPDDEAIRANNGTFSVQVILDPALGVNHQLQLLVDGQPHGSPGKGLQLLASNLDRGEHSLTVQVLSGDRVVQQSAAQTVHVQRTHINAPARRGKP